MGGRCVCTLKCIKTFLRKNLLTLLTLAGVIMGFVLGFSLRGATKWNDRKASYMSFLGNLWLNMLKCMVLPLITSSIITAVGNVKLQFSKVIACKGLSYYVCTTIIASILGIVLVTSISPGNIGKHPSLNNKKKYTDCALTADTLLDLFRSLVPPNIIQATVETYQTKIVVEIPKKPETNMSMGSTTFGTTTSTTSTTLGPYGMQPNYSEIIDMIPDVRDPCEIWRENKYGYPAKQLEDMPVEPKWIRGTNIVGVITYTIALSVAIVVAGDAGKPLLEFFRSLSHTTMLMTTWITWLSPVGIMFLVAGQIVGNESIGAKFETLGYYFLTVMLGIGIHGFIVLPAIYWIIVRKMPFKFMGVMSPAIITAFGTSSSFATVPITTTCLEKKAKMDSRIIKFLIPIGAAVNLDGTALYEAVASIYIAQLERVELDIGQTILVGITATIASMGAAGIPSAGLVTMVLVLNTIGIPADRVTYIIAVDWFLDRFRTACNVFGDSVGVAITQKLSKKHLDRLDAEEELLMKTPEAVIVDDQPSMTMTETPQVEAEASEHTTVIDAPDKESQSGEPQN